MDAKITKQRLSRMLSYDWIKIIGIIVAICIVWSLVFTMTATQITVTQKFYVYSYVGNNSFSQEFKKLYDQTHKNEFSYEILEIASEGLGSEVNTILEARFAVGEGDLMFIAHAPNKKDSYKVGEGEEEQTLYYNYTETFARGRARFLYSLEGEGSNTDNYFTQVEGYLSKYFFDGNGKADWENGTLDEEKVKADFRARVRKDKRFKTEAQLIVGEANDIKRLESYREALKEFYKYLKTDKIVQFETITYTDYNNEEQSITCYLNLNPSKPRIDPTTGEQAVDEQGYYLYDETVPEDGLTKYLSYNEDLGKNDGTTKLNKTSKNMCVGFLSMNSLEKKYRVEEGFQTECLFLVNALIRAAHGIN